MEPVVRKTQILENEAVCNSAVECGLDFEVNIPDYYAEAFRVLFYEIKPNIISKTANGTAVSVEGVAVFSMCYTDEDGKLCSFNEEKSFSKTVDVGCEIDDGYLSVISKCGYLNVKPLSSRRMSVHTVIELQICVTKKHMTDVINCIECENVYSKTEIENIEIPISVTEKNAVIEEELAIPSSLAKAKCVLRSNANAVIDGCKTVENKIIAKGTLNVDILYSGIDDSYNKFSSSVPFSQIIDAGGLNDECECSVSANVIMCDINPLSDYDNGAASFSLTAKLLLIGKVVCNGKVAVISDVFASECSVFPDVQPIFLDKRVLSFCENVDVSKQLGFSDGEIGDIIDLWYFVSSKTCRTDSGGISVCGAVTVRMLAADKAGIISYFERPVEFEYKKETDGLPENLRCDCTVSVNSADYSVEGDNSVSLRLNMSVCASVFEHYSKNVICNITLDEDENAVGGLPSFIVYYADSGEEVWDIAKKYSASPQRIMDANDIGETINECMPILITR